MFSPIVCCTNIGKNIKNSNHAEFFVFELNRHWNVQHAKGSEKKNEFLRNCFTYTCKLKKNQVFEKTNQSI